MGWLNENWARLSCFEAPPRRPFVSLRLRDCAIAPQDDTGGCGAGIEHKTNSNIVGLVGGSRLVFCVCLLAPRFVPTAPPHFRAPSIRTLAVRCCLLRRSCPELLLACYWVVWGFRVGRVLLVSPRLPRTSSNPAPALSVRVASCDWHPSSCCDLGL